MSLEVKIENLSNTSRRLKISVPASVVETTYKRLFSNTQKKATLKGFRPGKAPAKIIEQFYGDHISHDTYHQVIESALNEAIRKENLRAVGAPDVKGESDHDAHRAVLGHGIEFEATVDVIPPFEVTNYKGLKAKKPEVTVEASEVSAVLDRYLESKVMIAESDSAASAKEGDLVQFSTEGQIETDGVWVSTPLLTGDQEQVVGKGVLLKDFEEALLGSKVGSSKEISIAYDSNYGMPDLAGKKAKIVLSVQKISTRTFPLLDDALAQEFKFKDAAEMKAKAEEMVRKRKESDSHEQFLESLVAQLLQAHPLEIPESLVSDASKDEARAYASDLQRRGFDQSTIESLVKQNTQSIRASAQRSVHARLLLENIGEQENLDVKHEEILKELANVSYATGKSQEEITKAYINDGTFRTAVRSGVMTRKVMEFLEKSADLT